MSGTMSSVRLRRKQGGAATLLITVIIVLLVNIITYTMTRTTALENRMTASEIRSKQAFHAAQAGLDAAFEMIVNNDLANLSDCSIRFVDVDADGAPLPESTTFQLLFGAEDPQCPSPLIGLQTKSYIRSIGRSADGSAIRVLEVAIDLEREWIKEPAPPSTVTGAGFPGDAAIVSLGNIDLGGNSGPGICNDTSPCEPLASPGAQNPDISGVNSPLLVAAGSITGGEGGAVTVEDKHKSPNDPALTPYVDPATGEVNGDAFFQDSFGVSKDQFKDVAFQADGQASLAEVNVNPLVWHEGDLSLRGGGTGKDGPAPVYGSPDKPITLVVNGNLDVTANVIIWGVVYVTGNVGTGGGGDAGKAAGNMKVFGALVAEGDVGFAKGTSTFFFNDELSDPQPVPTDSSLVNYEVGSVAASFDTRSWREITL